MPKSVLELFNQKEVKLCTFKITLRYCHRFSFRTINYNFML